MSRRAAIACLLGLLIGLFSFQNAVASDQDLLRGRLLDRIQRLEDIEAIKQLKARFSYLDDAEDIEAIMDLFAEDAVMDLTEYGVPVLEGKEAIRAFLESSYASTLMTRHMVMNPVIKVDGNVATGLWYLIGTVTFGEDAQSAAAYWSQGTWEDQYVREGGEWKISRTTYHMNFMTLYSDPNGWVDGP